MPGHIPRRRMLQIAGGSLVVGTGAVGAWQWLAPEAKQVTKQGKFPARQAKARATESFVHVIAHPDDSLYFMNPELEQAIRSGAPAVTVCLTGGESDGRNALTHSPHYMKLPERRGDFVRARFNGFREATARMATGNWLSPWDVETLTLLPGFEVELQTLRAAPQVQLIFMELIEARTMRGPRKDSLRGLWLGATPKLTTLKPTGSPVRRTFHYGRQQLIDSLAAVMERYQPTVVRTLDPNPTHMPQDPHYPNTPPALQGIGAYYDHQDHTSSAHFAQAALAEYWGRKHARPTAVESYVGYEVGNLKLPANLDAAAIAHKIELLDIYGWVDGKDCGDRAGCGDRKVGARSKNSPWSNHLRHRATGTQRWVQPLPDGRLAAFAVLDGTAQCWTERTPGSGIWSTPAPVGPAPVRGTMLEGQVQAVRLPDGTLRLFSIRTVLPTPGKEHHRELVTSLQRGRVTGGGTPVFGPWESLGSPEADDPLRSMEMGYPVAVVAKDGKVHVFVKDWAGGVAFRTHTAGAWSDWAPLPADPGRMPRLEDGLDAALDEKGRLHVVAADIKTVHHWVSEDADGPLNLSEPTRLPATTGPLTLVPLPGGGMRMATRRPGTARVMIADRPAEKGNWRQTAECAPIGGYGRVAMAHAGNTAVLAARDDKGLVRVSTGSGRPGPWQEAGVPHRGTAGITQDAQGRTVAVVLGSDGLLSSTRGSGSGTTDFADWISHDGKPLSDLQSS